MRLPRTSGFFWKAATRPGAYEEKCIFTTRGCLAVCNWSDRAPATIEAPGIVTVPGASLLGSWTRGPEMGGCGRALVHE